MIRVILGLVLGIGLAAGLATVTADEPPSRKLTSEERKAVEARWQELTRAAVQAQRGGQLGEAAAAWEKALAAARQLYPVSEFADGHPDLAASLANLALLCQARGRFAQAEPLFREALQMRRRLCGNQDHPAVAQSENNLAGLYLALGRYTDAEPLFRETLAMYRRLYPQQDHPSLAIGLNNLALVLHERGQYVEAEPLYREALEMKRRLYPQLDHPSLAFSLNNLAGCLRGQGKYAEAETLHREALQMRRRLFAGRDHPELAMSLNNLAVVLCYRGQGAEAETLHREALQMYRRLYRGQDHPDIARTLNNLAGLLKDRGQYGDAELLFRDVLAMRRRVYAEQDHPELAQALNNLAGVLSDRGRYPEAEELFRHALQMRRRLYPGQDHIFLVMSLGSLAHALHLQGKDQSAAALFREALATHRALAGSYAAERSEGEALTLVASWPSTRDAFLANARALGLDPAAVYAEVWSSKAALARTYEQRALHARTASANPKVAAMLVRLGDVRHRRAELLLAPRPADPATLRQRDEALAGHAQQIEALERDLRPLLPAVDQAEKLARATPTDLQKALPPDAAVVDFLHWFCHEHDPKRPGKEGEKVTEHYLAFVLTRDKVAWLDLGDAGPIEAAVTAWRQAITAGEDIPPGLPGKVRDLVWTKVRRELPEQVKHVYLCPDLTLCRVPWPALPGDRPGTILLEEYALATIPHAVFLLDKLPGWHGQETMPQQGEPMPQRGKQRFDVLAVGGVTYDAAVPTQDKLGGNRGAPLLKPGQRFGWGALPGAAAEAKGVEAAATRKKLVSRTLGEEKATVSAVLEALPQTRYAHLATHGFFADPSFRSTLQMDPKLFQMSERGERIGAAALSPLVMTGLVLAGANKPGTPGRGILTGEALIDLDLSGLELAVLSACETGLGDMAGGEGTFGLQRAFHLAGTRNVVASLWTVPDRPTAALMALFYQNLWDKELPPIEALRQAQLEIYRHPEKIAGLAADFRGKFMEVPGTGETTLKTEADGKAHPRLWAAFTLSGPLLGRKK
jgi:CHAT domain-containing protein/Tfp pilus assembly protein PilF